MLACLVVTTSFCMEEISKPPSPPSIDLSELKDPQLLDEKVVEQNVFEALQFVDSPIGIFQLKDKSVVCLDSKSNEAIQLVYELGKYTVTLISYCFNSSSESIGLVKPMASDLEWFYKDIKCFIEGNDYPFRNRKRESSVF